MTNNDPMYGSKIQISPVWVEVGASSIEAQYPTRSREIAVAGLNAAFPYLIGILYSSEALSHLEIPEIAVEAAAKAMYHLSGSTDWQDIGYHLQWEFRDDARIILEAVINEHQYKKLH